MFPTQISIAEAGRRNINYENFRMGTAAVGTGAPFSHGRIQKQTQSCCFQPLASGQKCLSSGQFSRGCGAHTRQL